MGNVTLKLDYLDRLINLRSNSKYNDRIDKVCDSIEKDLGLMSNDVTLKIDGVAIADIITKGMNKGLGGTI